MVFFLTFQCFEEVAKDLNEHQSMLIFTNLKVSSNLSYLVVA